MSYAHAKKRQIAKQTGGGGSFRQEHITMAIPGKRLTFGPTQWVVGGTLPITMVIVTGRTLAFPWQCWQAPGVPTNEMMVMCHAGAREET